MKDIAGNILAIGDKVATTYMTAGALQTAEVIGFTPKKVKLRHTKPGLEKVKPFDKFPEQIAKVFNQ